MSSPEPDRIYHRYTLAVATHLPLLASDITYIGTLGGAIEAAIGAYDLHPPSNGLLFWAIHRVDPRQGSQFETASWNQYVNDDELPMVDINYGSLSADHSSVRQAIEHHNFSVGDYVVMVISNASGHTYAIGKVTEVDKDQAGQWPDVITFAVVDQ